MSFQSVQQRMQPEPIRQLAAASIPASNANPAWVKIGSTGLTNPSRILIIQNLTDHLVDISFDGSADATTGVSGNINLELPAGGQIVLDESANKSQMSTTFQSAGTTFWAQYPSAGSAPTTGNVNVSTIFAGGPKL